MSRPKTICDLCGVAVLNCNIAKHRNSKICKKVQLDSTWQRISADEKWLCEDGLYKCPYCDKKYNKNAIGYHIWRNHTDEGLLLNPNEGYIKGTKKSWNKGLTTSTDERVLNNSIAIKKVIDASENWGQCKEPEKELQRRQKLSIKAKENNFGGYRENAGRSKKFRVKDSYGKEVCLQSTYELRCSEILNELNIYWIRPKSLTYDGRKYYADFYLPEHDIWLDPKNNYKAKCDKEKIQKVVEQNGIRLYIVLEHQITKEFLTNLIRTDI